MNILLDAGPCLNFLAVSQQRILIELAESRDLPLAAPQRVVNEVKKKAQSDPRFRRTAAPGTWSTLTRPHGRVKVLDDTLTLQEFADAVSRISGVPAEQRVRDGKSLGEIMVMAHASLFAQQGEQVFVLMDDGAARTQANREITWLVRNKARGSIRLWSTPQVLREAGHHSGWIAGDLSWQAVYRRMTKFDDGLPNLDTLRH